MIDANAKKEIQAATASEPLTLEEEYAMQRSWRQDGDKLTFIICLPVSWGSHLTRTESREQLPGSRQGSGLRLRLKEGDDAPGQMLGDINLFLREEDEEEDEDGSSPEIKIIGEIELMIADKVHQRKGYGRAALLAFLRYVLEHEGEILGEFAGATTLPEMKGRRFGALSVKIGKENEGSLALFESVGFCKVSEEPSYFGEFELRRRRSELSRESVEEAMTRAGVEGYTEVGFQIRISASTPPPFSPSVKYQNRPDRRYQGPRACKEKKMPIPITIITGFLGSGKTTLLLNLIPQLPPTYRLALLKNEFGDVAIDSQLASTQAISGVRELLNGCICCNLVGQLSEALNQLRAEVQPDRIVIETSGSAFPATLAMEVNRLAREQAGAFVLDGVISVIDVENWAGYEDTSYTAKLQAKYTDLIIFNKWEGVSEERFETCLDRVGDLEVQTPWVKSDKGRVDKEVLLGIDGALFAKEDGEDALRLTDDKHHHRHDHQSEVEVLSVTLKASRPDQTIDVAALEMMLLAAPKDEVYRIKGTMRCPASQPPADSGDNPGEKKPAPPPTSGNEAVRHYILNWAFGRWTFTPSELVAENADPAVVARLTLILARYESGKWKKKLEASELIRLGEGAEGELVVERLV
ncbi:hypothetical protein CDV55_107220 [Aspergillus turcosus]|uniref:N-acetyltransferase domain-containing protein n=1 Tax=Aspergillus turcosus TaxID=1245748 RepID=A0A397IDQ5_9EURO|nr:hypothetical protein CDV55_107220 [Aspergillus turcosus]RLM00982.1 hypothetical protein CFD26_107282 [Aspergillus turcosus]